MSISDSGNVKVMYKGKEIMVSKEAYAIDKKRMQAERKYSLCLTINDELWSTMRANCIGLSNFKEAIQKYYNDEIDDMSIGKLVWENLTLFKTHRVHMSGDIFMLGLKSSGADIPTFRREQGGVNLIHEVSFIDEQILKEIFKANPIHALVDNKVLVALPTGKTVCGQTANDKLTRTDIISNERVTNLDKYPVAKEYESTLLGDAASEVELFGVYSITKGEEVYKYTELEFTERVKVHGNSKKLFISKIEVADNILTYNYETGTYENGIYWFDITVE